MRLRLSNIVFKLTFVILFNYNSNAIAGTILVVNTASHSVSLINDRNFQTTSETAMNHFSIKYKLLLKANQIMFKELRLMKAAA